jgi:hypothetical protein
LVVEALVRRQIGRRDRMKALDWRVLLLRSVIAAWVKGMARMG